MTSLAMKFVPIKNQKFDFGRTINPAKCSSCSTCNFLNCKNYAVQMQKSSYTIQEWVDHFKDDIKDWNFDALSELSDSLMVKFPKGLHWDYDSCWNRIRFVSFSRQGREQHLASINIEDLTVTNIDASEIRMKFVNKVRDTIIKINKMIQ